MVLVRTGPDVERFEQPNLSPRRPSVSDEFSILGGSRGGGIALQLLRVALRAPHNKSPAR